MPSSIEADRKRSPDILKTYWTKLGSPTLEKKRATEELTWMVSSVSCGYWGRVCSEGGAAVFPRWHQPIIRICICCLAAEGCRAVPCAGDARPGATFSQVGCRRHHCRGADGPPRRCKLAFSAAATPKNPRPLLPSQRISVERGARGRGRASGAVLQPAGAAGARRELARRRVAAVPPRRSLSEHRGTAPAPPGSPAPSSPFVFCWWPRSPCASPPHMRHAGPSLFVSNR